MCSRTGFLLTYPCTLHCTCSISICILCNMCVIYKDAYDDDVFGVTHTREFNNVHVLLAHTLHSRARRAFIRRRICSSRSVTMHLSIIFRRHRGILIAHACDFMHVWHMRVNLYTKSETVMGIQLGTFNIYDVRELPMLISHLICKYPSCWIVYTCSYCGGS